MPETTVSLLVAIFSFGFEHYSSWYGLKNSCKEANPFMAKITFKKWSIFKIVMIIGLIFTQNLAVNMFLGGGFFVVGVSNFMAIHTILQRRK